MPTPRPIRILAAKAAVLAVSLLFGVAVAQPTLTVGHIAPLTGPAANDARELNEGISAHLNEVNRAGGIDGRKLELFSLDDRYNGEDFSRQLEVAMARKPIALLSPLGISSMRALLNDGLLDKHDVVVINAVPGAMPLRSPGHARLFHVRASDRDQVHKALRHASTLGIKTLHVVLQDARAGGPDVATETRDLGMDDRLKLTFSEVANSPSALAQAAAEIASSDAQAVLVMGSPPYMAQTVAELRKAAPAKLLFALSYLPSQLVVNIAGADAARGVSIMQTYPNPMGRNLLLQRQFQAAMRTSHPGTTTYTAFHLEGYLSARVLTHALQRTNGAFTSSALTRSLRQMGPVEFGGFLVDFTSGNAGSRAVDIAVIAHNGRLMY